MKSHINALTGFLADTWWFGLSHRLSPGKFTELAVLRAEQGFSAIQLVVGIPPEVGPEHPDACSDAGPAWRLDGSINIDYLQLARTRIEQLNALGLRVIIYGAWGHQIDWSGTEMMQRWWQSLVDTLDDFDVIYCLCGEIGLWPGQADQLIPNLSTDDVIRETTAKQASQQTFNPIKKFRDYYFWHIRLPKLHRQRMQNWSEVLDRVSQLTTRPIIIHVNSNQLARDLIPDGARLSANTTQTGHRESSRNLLWQAPLAYLKTHEDDHFINLEPWYEGIRDSFRETDQLFAYWVSMLAGCSSYCYGAQGIWNIGDGRFMSHWGTQTFTTATQLKGASLVGQSHRFFKTCWRPGKGTPAIHEKDGTLVSISRHHEGEHIYYIPAIESLPSLPEGVCWIPAQGEITKELPVSGAVVIISSHSLNPTD